MVEFPLDVQTKEESVKQKLVLGKVKVPEGTETWMRYVTKSGEVVTQPRVIRRLSDAERAKREAMAKAKSEAWQKKKAVNAARKLAENKARLARLQEKADITEAKIRKALAEAQAKKAEIAKKLGVIEGA